MPLHQIGSAEAYRRLVSGEDAAAANGPGLVVHFGASWCSPCAELNALIESSIIEEYASAGVTFAYADVESVGDVCEAEGIESVPFIVFYRRKQDGTFDRVADVAGAKISDVTQNLISLFGIGGGADLKAKFSNLDDYIRALLKRDRIVLFITGTPSRPRCGFTRKIVTLLESYKATYVYFDIMSDNELCDRLKAFSNWPTFPQLYVDGELIGGCDVCQQMHDEGELKAALKL